MLLHTLASKKSLAPITPWVETSISDSLANASRPLSSCSSPAAALRKINRNCREVDSLKYEHTNTLKKKKKNYLFIFYPPPASHQAGSREHVSCCQKNSWYNVSSAKPLSYTEVRFSTFTWRLPRKGVSQKKLCVQALTNLLWSHWNQEYLPFLKQRQQWAVAHRNFQAEFSFEICLVIWEFFSLYEELDHYEMDKHGMFIFVLVKSNFICLSIMWWHCFLLKRPLLRKALQPCWPCAEVSFHLCRSIMESML